MADSTRDCDYAIVVVAAWPTSGAASDCRRSLTATSGPKQPPAIDVIVVILKRKVKMRHYKRFEDKKTLINIVRDQVRGQNDSKPTWSRVDEIGGQRGVGEVPRRVIGEAVLGLTVSDRPGRHFTAVVSDLRAHIVDAGRPGDRS